MDSGSIGERNQVAGKRQFEFIDDIATADAAYHAYGDSLSELLENAALGLFATMADIKQIKPLTRRQVSVKGDDREELLYNWLAELVYLKDLHAELYSRTEVTIAASRPLELTATLHGCPITELTGHTSCDVKAVTYHRLAIEESDEGLTATIVLDL